MQEFKVAAILALANTFAPGGRRKKWRG